MPKVESIGKQAFKDCDKITKITMPNVKSIATEAFGDCCSKLTTVNPTSPSADFSKPFQGNVACCKAGAATPCTNWCA